MIDCLFMSGEASATLPLAFSRSRWDHTSTPTILVPTKYTESSIRRDNRPREILNGIIHYADVSDKSIEENNLKLIKNKNIPCWPNPDMLLKMLDRHSVIRDCKSAGFINHVIVQDYKFNNQLKFPFVLKTGFEHRGLGKYLIKSEKDIPKWDGLATMEPFFNGKSVRVLIIGSDVFSVETINDTSWIKNSPGGEMLIYKDSDELISHAKDVAMYLKMDIAGVDYIVEESGKFHFLEINQYPGIAGFEHIRECARDFIRNKMINIEKG